jgi:putative Mn2+ efflux pump MntP
MATLLLLIIGGFLIISAFRNKENGKLSTRNKLRIAIGIVLIIMVISSTIWIERG